MRHARRVCLLEWAVDRDRIHAAALRVVQSLSVDAMPEVGVCVDGSTADIYHLERSLDVDS